MAGPTTLSGTCVFEVRTGGNDSYGGGFNSAAVGTDRSQSTSPYVTIDGSTNYVTAGASATTTMTLHGFTGSSTLDPGNLVQITSGSGTTPGVYQIISATSGTWVVDRNWNTTTVTAGVGYMGGCWASPGMAATIMNVSGQICYVKAGTYNMTTASAAAAGIVTLTNNPLVTMMGYDAVRGDRTGNRPIVSWASVASPGGLTYIYNGGTNNGFYNMAADGNNVANVGGFIHASNYSYFEECYAQNCSGTGCYGFYGAALGRGYYGCGAYNCGTGFYSTLPFVDSCTAWACGVGFNTNGTVCSDCLSYGNVSLATLAGIGFTTAGASTFVRCTADGNASDGFVDTANHRTVYLNCISTNNTGYGYNTTAASVDALLYCASLLNSARYNGAPMFDLSPILLSVQPYVNRAGNDFRLNNTAGGGASVYGKALAVYGQTNNRDIGAVQHTDPVAGGGVIQVANILGSVISH